MRRNNISLTGTPEQRAITSVLWDHHNVAERMSAVARRQYARERRTGRGRSERPARYMAALVIPQIEGIDEIDPTFYSWGATVEIGSQPPLTEINPWYHNSWTIAGNRYRFQRCSDIAGFSLITVHDGPSDRLRTWRQDQGIRGLHIRFGDFIRTWLAEAIQDDHMSYVQENAESPFSGLIGGQKKTGYIRNGTRRWLPYLAADEYRASLASNEASTEEIPIQRQPHSGIKRIEENAPVI